MLNAKTPKIPTSKLATLGVGGVRPGPGESRNSFPRPVPKSLGTRQGEVLPGERPQSGGPAGPSFLDSYKHNRNKFCGSWSVIGEIKEKGNTYRHFARLGCKAWTCPSCGPKKAKRLRKAIVVVANERKLTRFLTLTLDPKACSADQSIDHIRECWRKLRIYFNRRYKVSITFIAVLELQKSGYAHLHVLVDRYIPQRWLQQSWQSLGGGKFVNIKWVDVHRIAAYLSKYFTKEILLADFKARTRRYSSSRDIHLMVKDKTESKWNLCKFPIEWIFSKIDQKPVQIFCDSDGILLAFRVMAGNTSNASAHT